MTGRSDSPTVAILPWGLLIDDFLDRDGIALEAFATQFVGSWLFGYAEALRRSGVRAVVICISRRVSTRVQHHHEPSGATVVILPAPASYAMLRRRMRNPYGRSARAVFGGARGARLLVPLLAPTKEIAPYLATPLRSLARELRRQRCSSILAQEYEFPRFDACVLLGLLLGLPTFASFQGGDYQRWWVERHLRPLSIRRAAGLVIPSEAEIERVVETYGIPRSKIAQIPNPVDPSEWSGRDRFASRRRLGLSPTAPVVAWHGRVAIWKKGLDVLLEAWPSVAAIGDERPILLLVGSGRDADALEELLGRTDRSRIVWNRELVHDRARIADALAAADVYAFPSRHEGFPMAPIEAMAVGLPVVASTVHGTREIVGIGEDAGGILVPPEDAAALATAVTRLLQDEPLRQRLSDGARLRVRERFSLDTVGARLASFLTAAQARA